MTVPHVPLGRLASRFEGELIKPDDEGYDAARQVWNAAIDRRPALIARATSTADVVAGIRFGREADLPISVRGGGHSAPGFGVADDALMLDLSGMKRIDVDPGTHTALAQPGLVWREFDAAAQAHGLATTAAWCPRPASPG